MKLRNLKRFYRRGRSNERGSVFVIVLLISFGLVSIALYFANSMSLELRAADNRTSGMASDQIIEGATRYISSILANYATNGAMPDPAVYSAEAVPVGNAKTPEENGRFWLIGRDPNNTSTSTSSTTEPVFSLVDEASKLDLNATWVTSDVLSTNLSRMTIDFANAITDWRDTNGTSSGLNYSQYGYQAKHAPFESVGELRLVYGATTDILAGEDINRNGVLDASEHDDNGNGYADPGVMEYFTVYSRQPNTHSDGTALTNVTDRTGMQTLLEDRLGSSRATAIIARVFGGGGGAQGGGQFGGGNGGGTPPSFGSVLQFFMQSGMTSDEFGMIYNDVTVTNAPFSTGRININTAPPAVLACLPGMDANSLQTIVSYRESNPTRLASVAWLVDALGTGSSVLTTLAQGDYLTTQSYQFSADIAAVGPFGRGYKRVRVVFDISEGTPKIIYRQDLSRLGWALGKQTRETWIVKNTR